MAGGVAARTDSSLWTKQRAFGVAGGPDEVVLTDLGSARAFSIGAKVQTGAPAQALEALSAAGGSDPLSTTAGLRHRATDLGRRFDMVVWGRLKALGYVEFLAPAGVQLTEQGRRAIADGNEERAYLLRRCRAAATPEVP